MKNKISIISLLFLSWFCAFGNYPKDSLSIAKTMQPLGNNIQNFVPSSQLSDQFALLDKKYPVATNINVPFENLTPEFSFQNLAHEFAVNDDVLKMRKEAQMAFELIQAEQRYIGELTHENIIDLPIGLSHKNEGGTEYSLGIIKATIFPEYTQLLVFGRLKLPQTDEDGRPMEIFFGSDNVKLSHQGGIIGDANLTLLGDVHIPFNSGNWLISLKGGLEYSSGNIQNKTYATIDCDGIKEIGLEGSVQISRNVLLPVSKNGNLSPKKRKETIQVKEGPNGEYITKTIKVPNRVQANFKFIVSGWSDILIEVSLKPFVLTKHPDKFAFIVDKAILDLSDIRTEHVGFPKYYKENGLLDLGKEAWRGFYVKKFDVLLPKEFKTVKNIKSKKRISFGAEHLIIDNYGISGNLFVSNLIPLDEGRTSEKKAWAISVDQISVEIAANHLIKGELEGKVILPISSEKHLTTSNKNDKNYALNYLGIISEEEYLIRVKSKDALYFNVWNAEAELSPNSSIEMKIKDHQFLPKAILHGKLAITANQKKTLGTDRETVTDEKGKEKAVDFKGIQFRKLVVQTESPVLSVGYFGYNDEVRFMNFPVSIANIELKTTKTKANLLFDLKLNLMNKEDKGFAAETTLLLQGKYEEKENKQGWAYNDMDVGKIEINANTGGFSIKGHLEIMTDHPEYGNGFSGELNATIKAFKNVELKASAIFGKTDFRYWYFDAMADNLPTGKAGTPITLKGIGGGAFYRMERRGFSSAYTPSGLSYVPNGNRGLGLKAMVAFGVVNDKALNGKAGFEILFNRYGGINKMGLYGEGHLMKDLADLPGGGTVSSIFQKIKDEKDKLDAFLDRTGITETLETITENKLAKPFIDMAKEEFPTTIEEEAGVNGYLGIEYDFTNKTLHGELDVYIDIVGGVLQGRASKGRAGWAVLHIAPDKWYLHVGTPTDKLGLKLGIGPLSVEAGGYFMIGDQIPGSPPPPPKVAEILGLDADILDYMRDENALGDGKGFAFGADFQLDTGDIRFLIFYARFQAGAGFDIMLKDYGEAQCVNRNRPLGINGWYANGQAYAYLQGELGIKIKLFLINKKIPIIKAGAAVLFQAKAPNPVWMRGYLGGHYNLLGGLIKGRFRFKITLGKECEFANTSPLDGLKIISGLTPDDTSIDVDVFSIPQAAFNVKVNEPIIIPEDQGDKTYKVILEQFKITDETGKEIEGRIQMNSFNTSATYISDDILPPNTALKVIVEVSFQEKTGGIYKTVMIDGKPATEIEERHFTTGSVPNHIPLNNIAYAYPVLDQQYFYMDEHPNGFIQLKRGQDYLFDDDQWKSSLKIGIQNADYQDVIFKYLQNENKVSYTMPNVKTETQYQLVISSSPKNSGSSKSDQVAETHTDLGNDNTISIQNNLAQNLTKEGEIERLTYQFKTSKFKTFAKKVNDINTTGYHWGKIASDVIFLTNETKKHEGFDMVELVGNDYSGQVPLILAESDLEDSYFILDIDPILYQKHPITADYSLSRDIEPYGFRPKRALPILTNYLTSLEYEVDLPWRFTHFPYRYNLPDVYKADFIDIQSKVINAYVNGHISRENSVLNILNQDYLFMRFGNYSIILKYTLPGGIEGTSANYKYKNLNRFR